MELVLLTLFCIKYKIIYVLYDYLFILHCWNKQFDKGKQVKFVKLEDYL